MADKNNTALANAFLAQLMNQQGFIGQNLFNFGRDTLGEAKTDITGLQDFFNNILSGKDTGKLLDFINPDEINKNYDTAVSTTSELSPRGGLRTSTLGNLDFLKMGDIQNVLQGVRAKAPDALTQLAAMLGNLGTGALSTSEAAYGTNLQAILAQLGFHQQDKANKAAIISGLLSAAGSVGGAIAGHLLK